MKNSLIKVVVLASLALSGCATQSISTFQSFQAKDLNPAVRRGALRQTTNTFFVINDSSSSTGDVYSGSGFPGQSGLTKLSVEKELLNRMNKTIPNIKLSSGLRSFGYGPCTSWGFTDLNQAVQKHSSSLFDSSLNTLKCSSGGTPAATAFEEANADLSSAPGRIAVILLSDGHNYNQSPAGEVQALKDEYGTNLCVYTIWVGNENERDGQAILQNLSDISGCGFSTTADAISSKNGMAGFVTKVFFNQRKPAKVRKVTKVREGDADGDGVLDSKDKCPNTPKGAIVDRQGCWSLSGVLFDTNKATIKAGYESVFNNAITVLKLNPSLTVEIQGHTDSMGSASYNQNLSERRAKSVQQHLVKNGINASRMTTKGFGESRPTASNKTATGRAENRRVAFNRTDK